MASNQKKPFTSDIKEWLGVVKESKNSNWCKCVYKVAYNDKPTCIDIRNIQYKEDGTQMFGKGISLSDEDCDNLVDILIEKGYGSITVMEQALHKRNQIFSNEAFEEPNLTVEFKR